MRYVRALALAAAANLALYLVHPLLFLLSIVIAPIAAAAWTLLASITVPLLVKPGRTYFVEPGSGGEPGAKALLRYSLIPAMFSFSLATVAADLVGFEVASADAFAMLAAYTLLLLPLLYVGAPKYTLDVLDVQFLDGGRGRLDVPGWLEEFVGGGALVSFLLYLRGLASTLEPAGAVAYGIVYILVTVAPALTAMLIYSVFGSRRVARRVLGRARPVVARLVEELVCPRCGAAVSPGADRCPSCGAALRAI